jgi:hypothetical protein
MNAVLIGTKSKMIESGKQYPGTWLLAAIDLLLVLALCAAVAYTPAASTPVAASQAVQTRLVTASNAQNVSAQPNLARLAGPTAATHYGMACDNSPAGCGGANALRFIDPPMSCPPLSHAAQHRGLEDPCAGMR